MSFNLMFEKDSSLVYIKALRDIDLSSGARLLSRLASDDRSQNGFGILFDATEICYVPSREEVDALSRSDAWRKIIERYRVAIVVSKPIQYGVANILARKSESSGGLVERFYNVDNARAWLEKIAAEKPKTLKAGS